jgi:hypothetical protein
MFKRHVTTGTKSSYYVFMTNMNVIYYARHIFLNIFTSQETKNLCVELLVI